MAPIPPRILLLAAATAAAVAAVDAPGTTRPFSRDGPSPLSAADAARLREPGAPVEQVHLLGGGPSDPVLVSFVTAKPQVSAVEFRRVDVLGTHWDAAEVARSVGGSVAWTQAVGTSSVYSSLNFYVPTDGEGVPDYSHARWGDYRAPQDWYTSAYIHLVRLDGLVPGATYAYRIPPMQETVFTFTAPKAVDPGAQVSFGVVADLGQTKDSLQTMEHLQAQLPHLDQLLFVGDLSYADGYGPRWDSFGRMAEPLFSRITSACVGGNHELIGGESWVGLQARWPAAATPRLRGGSGANPLFYSYDTGPVHVLALNSYVDVAPTAEMIHFVTEDLAQVDRSRTPWVIAMWHTPFYTSSSAHSMRETEVMRGALEKVLYDHRVDLVFNGHVHAYERTRPVYREHAEECGIVYITIGDGGNREGLALPWSEPQPAWSAFREASFGFGRLKVDGADSATWHWYRNVDGGLEPAEIVHFTRGACGITAREVFADEDNDIY